MTEPEAQHPRLQSFQRWYSANENISRKSHSHQLMEQDLPSFSAMLASRSHLTTYEEGKLVSTGQRDFGKPPVQVVRMRRRFPFLTSLIARTCATTPPHRTKPSRGRPQSRLHLIWQNVLTAGRSRSVRSAQTPATSQRFTKDDLQSRPETRPVQYRPRCSTLVCAHLADDILKPQFDTLAPAYAHNLSMSDRRALQDLPVCIWIEPIGFQSRRH